MLEAPDGRARGNGNREPSTSALGRVIEYEPAHLTIGVEAGMPWRDLVRLAGGNRQILPLDPPFAKEATVGGVIATNGSGPAAAALRHGARSDDRDEIRHAGGQDRAIRRHGGEERGRARYGQADDRFVRDTGCHRIGEFQAAPAPEMERTFALRFGSAAEAVAARNRILTSALQPSAVDLLNPAAGAALDAPSWALAIGAGRQRGGAGALSAGTGRAGGLVGVRRPGAGFPLGADRALHSRVSRATAPASWPAPPVR